MCEKTKEAIEMYNQAFHAEQEGKAALAESYYLQSRGLFVEAVEHNGAQYLHAANALNALTFLRWAHKDYEGALRSAKDSVKLMETYEAQFSPAEDADFIYGTSCELLDQMRYQKSLASTG